MAMYSGMRLVSWTQRAHLVMGFRNSTWSISWRAPFSKSVRGLRPPMRSMGLRFW